MDFRVHWLSITIWGKLEYGLAMWGVWFEKYLGVMHSSGHGGRGFKQIYTALAASRLYGDPPLGQDAEKKKSYFHIELPGQACDALPVYLLREFMMDLFRHEKFKVKRIDLAWDGVSFTPGDVKTAIDLNLVRSLAKRNKMVFTTSPYELREDGRKGTSSCQLGSRYSTRMIRVYDKRGPTRIEFQARDKRAHLIAVSLTASHIDKWASIGISHLRDYIDFLDVETGEFLDWWSEFVTDIARANKTVTDAREIELNRMVSWIYNQVTPTLSVLEDVYGSDTLKDLIDDGRKRRGNRFKSVLEQKYANR